MPSRARTLTDSPALLSADALEKRLAASWASRRKWSRNDTAAFLNDRSSVLLAHLRRRSGTWPKHSLSIGRWLKSERTDLFDRAHATLAAAPSDDLRERLLPSELV